MLIRCCHFFSGGKFSFDPEKHLPLHPMLDLASSEHHVQHFHDGAFVVLLLDEVLDDGVLGDLRADHEAPLQLLLDEIQLLLIFLSRET